MHCRPKRTFFGATVNTGFPFEAGEGIDTDGCGRK
jgi:hypothetical protein